MRRRVVGPKEILQELVGFDEQVLGYLKARDERLQNGNPAPVGRAVRDNLDGVVDSLEAKEFEPSRLWCASCTKGRSHRRRAEFVSQR